MREIHVGLIGFGTVGSGLAQVLKDQQQRIAEKSDLTVRLKTVADINVTSLPSDLGDVRLTRDAAEIFTDPEISIVVELIGGIEPAKTFILKAIAAGKHVVTANKALISQHGRRFSPRPPRKGSRSASKPASAAAFR